MSPVSHLKRNRQRQSYLSGQMLEDGFMVAFPLQRQTREQLKGSSFRQGQLKYSLRC